MKDQLNILGRIWKQFNLPIAGTFRNKTLQTMETSIKRPHDEARDEEMNNKVARTSNSESWFSGMTHGKGRLIPQHVFNSLTDEEKNIIEKVNNSCTDLELIERAINIRIKHRLTIRLPEDWDSSSYYIEDGLRKVYPYPFTYQTYAKRRWLGRLLIDILRNEFRDIAEKELRLRFEAKKLLVNGQPVDHRYKIKDNDFIAHIIHRHELPVLATPILKIFEDDETLVIDKPPSVPIHPCGRYRYNSVISLLEKEYSCQDIRTVHRLDRLVSGVLMIAKNKTRAQKLETMIQNRDVMKEYVCRVVGNFPDGLPEDDGFITVDQPLDKVPGKIGLTVVHPEGKESSTRFKKLNYNGKTSAVLCQPKTGRMHQIRVHLQFLGHPIVNDSLYNSDSFGPERGKGGRFGKSLRQLSQDVINEHRANNWIIGEDNGLMGSDSPCQEVINEEDNDKTSRFLNDSEKAETLAALGHFFTDESWKEMQQKLVYNPSLEKKDPDCRDCHTRYHDPPLRRLFLYLHAFRYSGTGWCYESDMPVWARDSWEY